MLIDDSDAMLSSDGAVVVSRTNYYRPMGTCPGEGKQVQLLLQGGVCVRGAKNTLGAIGWAPFPFIPETIRKLM